MEPIKYITGDLIQKGDMVEVKRFLFKNLRGKVIYVYNPHVPTTPNGKNEFGYSIRLKNGSELWGEYPGKETILISRGKGAGDKRE